MGRQGQDTGVRLDALRYGTSKARTVEVRSSTEGLTRGHLSPLSQNLTIPGGCSNGRMLLRSLISCERDVNWEWCHKGVTKHDRRTPEPAAYPLCDVAADLRANTRGCQHFDLRASIHPFHLAGSVLNHHGYHAVVSDNAYDARLRMRRFAQQPDQEPGSQWEALAIDCLL